jgi:hypothetical protein
VTTPEDAGATTRDPSNMSLHAASALEAVRVAGVEPPQPVPMTDPIDDVTKGL